MTDNPVGVQGTRTGERGMMGEGGGMPDLSRLSEIDWRGWIQGHPLEASLAALGVGFVVGLLFLPRGPDKYDRLERRLDKAMKDVVKVKEEVDEELEHIREMATEAGKRAKTVKKEQHKAEKRTKELEEQREELEDQAEEHGGRRASGVRAMVISALSAQLVHLLTRWVSERVRGKRETEGEYVGQDQPTPGEYSYTPPI